MVLDRVPEGKKVSMEREIFPDLVDEDLYCYEFEGYWIDCGRPSSLFEANRTLLDEKGKKKLIGDKSVIEGELGEYVTLGDDCTIGRSSINNSMIYDGVEIGDGCIIENSILGYDVIVEDDVTIKDSIISDGLYLEKKRDVINEKL